MEAIEVIPSARRLIQSLRDMGYDFSQAVADVVDNSIEAGATLVAIDVEFNGNDSWVRIADNGKGMNPEELREAMRYGAEREYDSNDLGKFGLGLKTASMSQCQCLSVASRWNKNRADVAAYSWDLEHIKRTNRWEILPLERDDLVSIIRDPLKDATGTVILWKRLDRILGYKLPYGESARKRLAQTCREIETHLGMVFHRFLTQEARSKRFKLLLNGNEIQPWDPFCRSERMTKELLTVSIPIEYEGVSGDVLLEPFILPAQSDFSSADAFQNASGPANWNQQQGFYIYRAGRMIQNGGWSGLRTPDEHTKLARIALSFPPALDEAFKINVAKMRVQMPALIRDTVGKAIGPVAKLAREIYDRKSAGRPIETSSQQFKPALTSSPTNNSAAISTTPVNLSANLAGKGNARPSTPQFTLEEWSHRLLAVTKKYERPIVKGVLKRLLERP